MKNKLPQRLIKDHLINVFWTLVAVLVFAGLGLLGNAVFPERILIDIVIDGIDLAAQARQSGIATFLAIAAITVVALLLVSYVTGIIYAATTRTYLGAGVARRSYIKSLLAAWGASAIAVAVGCVLVAVVAGAIQSDFSGTVPINGHDVNGLLWYVPMAALVGVFLSHSAGFLTGMVFVRFPWWIGVAVIVALSYLDTLTHGTISSWAGLLDWADNGGGVQLLKHAAAGIAETVIVVGASWAMLRRLSIRR